MGYIISNDIRNKLGSSINEEKFRFVFYFFQFVMPDILILLNFLPLKVSAVLDIGAGVGLFDIFVHQFYPNKPSINIIEMNK